MGPSRSMHPGRWDRVFMWPFLETRRFFGAVGRYWRRILVGAFVGWLVAVVLGAVALALLELEDVISQSTSDGLAIVIVLGGVGLGALGAYAIRPSRPEVRGREEERVSARRGRPVISSSRQTGRRWPASTRPPRAPEGARPRGSAAAQPRRRRSRAANR
jgi:hypothetical protein